MNDEHLRKSALKALVLDPVGTAEKITGKLFENDSSTVILGHELKDNNKLRKRAILSELGDTYNGIPWSEFLSILSSLSFEIVQSKRSVEEREDGIVVSPTHIIAAHRRKKLIIFADSYVPTDPQKDQVIGGGKICGSVDVSGLEEGIDWQYFLGQISFSFYGNKMQFYFGVVEALVTRLQLVESTAPFCDWPADEGPTMLHDLLGDKISDLPDWAIKFMETSQAEEKK